MSQQVMYQVREIPLQYNARKVQKHLQSVLERDGIRDAVHVRSIAISPDQKSKMATVHFKNPPAWFSLNGNERSVEIPNVDRSGAKNGDHKDGGDTVPKAPTIGYDAVERQLLEKRADVNARVGRFGNALRAASEKGHEPVVRLLLEKGADAKAQVREYGNALRAASIRGHKEVVRLLLEKGADVNAPGGFYGNALQAASSGGHKAVVQLLLEKGANVNAPGGFYGSALQAASEQGHEAVVRLLLEKGADVNAPVGKFGSALQAASERGHEAVVQLLLEKGADVNAQGGKYGDALRAASFWGYEAVVQRLLEKGADINARGGEYGNALQAASSGKHEAVPSRKYEAVVRLLLEKGADVNARGGKFGSALQAASGVGYEAVMQLLLERGADVNAQGGEHGNALQVASRGGHEAVVRRLLEKRADVNAQGGMYGNALQAASRGGHEAVVRLLLENGADVSAQGGEYGNALQAALRGGHEAVVRLLLENGADINTQGGRFGNALQAAPDRRQLKNRAGLRYPRTAARGRTAAQSTYDQSPPAISNPIRQSASARNSTTPPSQSNTATRKHANAANPRNTIDQIEIAPTQAEGTESTAPSQGRSVMAQPTYHDASSFAAEGNLVCEIIKRGPRRQRHASRFSLIAPSVAAKTSRIDDFKGFIESYVNAPILWWPLRQRRLASQAACVQITWQCTCGANFEAYILSDTAEAFCRNMGIVNTTIPGDPLLPTHRIDISNASQTPPQQSGSAAQASISQRGRPTASDSVGVGSTTLRRVPQPPHTTQPATDRYLHWCVDARKAVTRLIHMELSSITDSNLIPCLLKMYNSVHGFRTWLTLTSCCGVRLIKFRKLCVGADLVRVSEQAIPPKTDQDYEYIREPTVSETDFINWVEAVMTARIIYPRCPETLKLPNVLQHIPKKINGKLQQLEGYGAKAIVGYCFWRAVVVVLLLATIPLAIFAVRRLIGHKDGWQNVLASEAVIVGLLNILVIQHDRWSLYVGTS